MGANKVYDKADAKSNEVANLRIGMDMILREGVRKRIVEENASFLSNALERIKSYDNYNVLMAFAKEVRGTKDKNIRAIMDEIGEENISYSANVMFIYEGDKIIFTLYKRVTDFTESNDVSSDVCLYTNPYDLMNAELIDNDLMSYTESVLMLEQWEHEHKEWVKQAMSFV